MQLTVEGVHVTVTPTLQNYAEEKMRKLSHHFEHITSIHVTLSLENLKKQVKPIAEARINVPGDQLFAKTMKDDMYEAIDDLHDKLDRQLVKFKEKIKDHRLSSSEREAQRTE